MSRAENGSARRVASVARELVMFADTGLEQPDLPTERSPDNEGGANTETSRRKDLYFWYVNLRLRSSGATADMSAEKAKVVDVLNEVMPQIEEFVGAQLANAPSPRKLSLPKVPSAPVLPIPTSDIESAIL